MKPVTIMDVLILHTHQSISIFLTKLLNLSSRRVLRRAIMSGMFENLIYFLQKQQSRWKRMLDLLLFGLIVHAIIMKVTGKRT